MDIMLFGYKMDIILFLAIVGLILSFIWNSYNTYQNWKQDKKYETIILRLTKKKRLFNNLYYLTKDLTKRIEFTDTIEIENYTTYKFKIRDNNGADYLSNSRQKILMRRIILLRDTIYKVCGYELGYEGLGVELNEYEELNVTKTIGLLDITYPNDALPKDFEEIKKDLLEDIILIAKENGVKIKES